MSTKELEKELYESLNSKKSNNLIPIYLELQQLYESIYGKNSILFIEIGSFFEIYQVENKGKAKEISEILNIQLTRKNKSILETSIKNPLMAGIPSVSIEKYLSRLIDENKWTIILVKQEGIVPNISRKLDKIISPGTNINFLKSEENNFITSIFLDKNNKDVIISGVSAIDLSTGESVILETYGTFDDKNIAIDELNEFLISYKSNEILIIKDNIEDFEIENIIKNLNIENISYVIKNYDSKNENNKLSYQNELFKKVFETKSFLNPIEELDLETKPFATISLVNLIEFIIEHDYKIVNSINKPKIINSSKLMFIGNNALKQLDIVTDYSKTSVLDIINLADTPMGRRLCKDRIKNPIIDKKELERRYQISEFLTKENYSNEITNSFKFLFDIERLNRRINLQILHPYEMSYFLNSLKEIEKTLLFLQNKIDFSLFNIHFKDSILEKLNEIIKEIENRFIIEKLSKFNLLNIEENFLNLQYYPELKNLILNFEKEYEKIENISNYFSNFIHNQLQSKKELIHSKVSFTDRDGFFIEISKNKFKNNIKEMIQKIEEEHPFNYILNKFNYKILTQTVKIDTQDFRKISDDILISQRKIIIENKSIFIDYLKEFSEKNNEFVQNLIYLIAEIDVYNSNAKLYKKHFYKIPKIINTNDEMFIETINLRHPIIEKIENNGIYIPNDIILGNKKYSSKKDSITFNEKDNVNGILLYGINSSGKSSLMKSVGISIILAQAGFFVPATEFKFSIFKKIFTRIYGEDNIHKGLSTFAVEMLELKNILKRGDKNSLILGDEISHGTETISGLSIVSSAVYHLAKRNNLFIFATHLHQLVNMEIIKNIENLIHLHLSIHYDEKNDKLIYDRKLKYGSGSSLYGLEFAKSLQMDEDFLLTANKIRKELSNDFNEKELLIQKNKSKYNSNCYIDKCLFCENKIEKAEDVHHIVEQQNADDNNFINHYHKNHKFNLLPLCKEHHKQLHSLLKRKEFKDSEELIKWVKTSHGIELFIDEKIKDEIKNKE